MFDSAVAAIPVARQERVSSVDVLRGVALLGILLMNIVAMGLPHWAYDDPTIVGNRGPADFWAWAINAVLFEGKMRTIFSMLFGAGIILLTSRAEERGSRDTADIHFRRNLWLVLFGMIHGYLLLWPGDILYTYGLGGMALFVFRRVRPRNLLIIAAVILATQAPKMYGFTAAIGEAREKVAKLQAKAAAGQALTREQQKEKADAEKMLEGVRPKAADVQKEIDDRRQGYLHNLKTFAPVVMMLESMFTYKIGIWDALSMMVVGMAFMKMGVFSASRSYRFYALMALGGYGYGLPVGWWVVYDWMHQGFDPATRWFVLYDTTRLAVAVGHIAVVMLICKSGTLGFITRPLAAVGQMALTNYIMHSVVVMFVFHGYGFGLFGQLARHQLYYVVAGIWIFQLIASPIWLRHFQFGPMEWLWRSLTYKKKQPMRLRTGAPEPAVAML